MLEAVKALKAQERDLTEKYQAQTVKLGEEKEVEKEAKEKQTDAEEAFAASRTREFFKPFWTFFIF